MEFEQGGEKRAGYGEELLDRLADDLTARFGRGFSRRNLQSMRQFYQSLPATQIWQTVSAKSSAVEERVALPSESAEAKIVQTPSAKSKVVGIRSTSSSIFQTPSGKSGLPLFRLDELAAVFPLPWSHYVLLVRRSRSPEAFAFYHAEALRGGWSMCINSIARLPRSFTNEPLSRETKTPCCTKARLRAPRRFNLCR